MFFEELSKISKFYIFETLLGIVIIWFGIKLYINDYLNSGTSSEIGILIIGLLIVGCWLFMLGFSSWRDRYKKEQKLEDKKREADIKEQEFRIKEVEKKLENLNRKDKHLMYTPHN